KGKGKFVIGFTFMDFLRLYLEEAKAMTNKKTEINYSDEAAYYISQQILLNLLVTGKINLEEYVKIDNKNRETFNPFLSRIMV
ncbi:TPA: SHOCT domain-containing protein, partial [Enterococcus faecium]